MGAGWRGLIFTVGLVLSSFSLTVTAETPKGGARSSAAQARALLDAGKAAFRARDYDEAARLFREAYDHDTRLVLALYNRAFALRKGGKLDAARAAYLEYLAVAPGDLDGLFGLAETERLLGNKRRARDGFSEYVAKERRPGKEKYLAYARAKIEELGGTQGAASAADEMQRGAKLYSQHKYRQAAAAFARAYDVDESLHQAIYRQALALRKAAAYAEATAAYRRYRTLEPDDLDGLFGLAETERLAGDKDAAIADFQAYLAREQRSGRERFVRYAKDQLKALGVDVEAPGAAEVAGAGAAEAARLFDAGVERYQARQYEKAAQLFDQAYAADTERVDALYRRALAERRAGRLDDAKTSYRAFLDRVPHDPDATYGLAVTYDLLGDIPKARAAFAAYIDVEKRASEQKCVERARRYLEETARHVKVVPRGTAKKSGDGAAAARPPRGGPGFSHRAQAGRALSYLTMLDHGERALAAQDFARADEHFALALAMEPDDPRALLGRGLALQGLGHRAQAISVLKRAVAIAPDSEWGKKAEAALDGGAGPRVPRRARVVSASEKNKAQARLAEAQQKLDAGDVAGALEVASEAIAADPELLAAHLLVGEAQLRKGSAAKALVAFQRAFALRPDKAAPIWGLARAYERMGERRIALHHYRLYADSKADDVDKALARKAWLKVEGAL